MTDVFEYTVDVCMVLQSKQVSTSLTETKEVASTLCYHVIVNADKSYRLLFAIKDVDRSLEAYLRDFVGREVRNVSEHRAIVVEFSSRTTEGDDVILNFTYVQNNIFNFAYASPLERTMRHRVPKGCVPPFLYGGETTAAHENFVVIANPGEYHKAFGL